MWLVDRGQIVAGRRRVCGDGMRMMGLGKGEVSWVLPLDQVEWDLVCC